MLKAKKKNEVRKNSAKERDIGSILDEYSYRVWFAVLRLTWWKRTAPWWHERDEERYHLDKPR